jgi:hypothetical protein
MVSLGGGGGGNLFGDMNLAPFELPAFDEMPALNFQEKPTFVGAPVQKLVTPQMSNDLAQQLPARTTTTPPPYYTVAVDITNVPTFKTTGLTLYEKFPALDALATVRWSGPILETIKKFVG